MKTKGVLLCLALLWAMWGSADPSLNEAPESFSLHCPKDVTVNCDEDLTNLSKWGDAYVWKDYVKMSAGHPKITDERNTCGIGVIKRTWRVEDPHWKWHTCTQTITVRGKGTFDENDIIWPQSWTLDTCRVNLHPNNLPRDYSYPRFKNKECAKPAYSYHDEYFEFGPHCAKLIRTWSVIDWCQYVPYPGSTEGKWQHVQVIKVDQKSKPTIDCPKDTVIYASDCDSAEVILEDVIAISKCGDTLKVKNKSPYAEQDGNNASGKYPIGVHEFYYITEYGCGREAKCKFTVEVKPAKPPTPYCKNGIITTLMPMDTNRDQTIDIGMREVWASDLDVGSFHACYPNAKLKFSFSKDTNDTVIVFDCDNIGRNEVELWVTDEFGNQAYCITYVVVQNNNPKLKDCMPDSLRTGTIAGHLTMADGQNITNVEVALFGEDAAFSVRTTVDTITDAQGNKQVVTTHDTSWFDITKKNMAKAGGYKFKDLKRFRNYEVSALKNDGMMNGVDMWDYYSLFYHNLGFYKITDPVDLIAGDIDGNGKINKADENLLISAIFNPSWPDAQFESWRFYDRGGFDIYQQTAGAMPDQLMRISNLDIQKMDVDFVGVKIGDLDGTVDPSGVKNNATRSQFVTEVNLDKNSGGAILRFDQEVLAGQLFVKLQDGIRLEEVIIDGGEGFVSTNDHQMYQINWVHATGAREIKMVLSGHQNQSDVAELWLTQNSYAYLQDGKASDLKSGRSELSQTFELMTVAPNPVDEVLNLYFYASQADEYELSIYNANGQLVQHKNIGSFDYGHEKAAVNVADLPRGTAYYFRLTNSFSTVMGTFVK